MFEAKFELQPRKTCEATFTINATPSKISQLENDENFLKSENIKQGSGIILTKDGNDVTIASEAFEVAVTSVNGETGDVVLNANDVGALPDITVIPAKTSDLVNDNNFISTETDPIYSADKPNIALKSEIPDISNFVTEQELADDLATKADISDIPDVSNFVTTSQLNTKVDKEEGKTLTSNDFSNADKTKLDNIEDGAEKNDVLKVNNKVGNVVLTAQDVGALSENTLIPEATSDLINDSDFTTNALLNTGLDTKVNKEAGKTLTTNDYTTAEKTKLAGIQANADKNTVLSVNSKIGDVMLNKTDIGLGSVDNTSDNDKPISNATQNALNQKADSSALDIKLEATNIIAGSNVNVSTQGNDVTISATAEPYNLPVATETALGGIKASAKADTDTQECKIGDDGKLYVAPASTSSFDGNNILVGNGIVKSTNGNDVTLSAENFLLPDTVITVGTSANANYATLQEALDYVGGKWSSGTINIEIEDGTYITTASTYTKSANIPLLQIYGKSRDKTKVILKNTTISDYKPILGFESNTNYKVIIKNMTFEGLATNNVRLISITDFANVIMNDLSFNNTNIQAVYCAQLGNLCLTPNSTYNFTNCNTPISTSNATTVLPYGCKIYVTNANIGLQSVSGGLISVNRVYKYFTNVTTETAPTLNTMGQALIQGAWAN